MKLGIMQPHQFPYIGYFRIIDAVDQFVVQEELRTPDLVKIDVEGQEMEVLDGMRGLIGASHPQLLVELHGVGSLEVVARLLDHGYRVGHVERGLCLGLGSSVQPSGHLYCSWRSASAPAYSGAELARVAASAA